ncbi:MAG: nuclear transport factor 2 family protein [Chitinophagales bacterium]|nr:nuclear transport factor 2 family protein [Chitinophagales bacterium]
MTTQEVADKFYEYMQIGAFDKIYDELYSNNCVSKETPGSNWEDALGMVAIHEKGKKFNESIEAMHGGTTEKPRVAGNYFTSFMTMDFTPKGGSRQIFEEIGMYEVRDGKIISEQFYY